MALIDILLATYNGEKYIAEQIDSIMNQSVSDFKIIVHDDGSTDSTVTILKDYVTKFPGKIFLVEDGIFFGGAKDNFFHLLKMSSANYIMFADQDDVWLKDKIEITLSQMLTCENVRNDNTPVLIYTDLTVVDSKLGVIADSLRDLQKLKSPSSLEGLLLRNSVTGCTVMINRHCLSACHVTTHALMHDWWLAIGVLRANGCLFFISKSTILYRQHDNNSVGAKKTGFIQNFRKVKNFKKTIYDLRLQYQQFNAIIPIGFLRFLLKKIKVHVAF